MNMPEPATDPAIERCPEHGDSLTYHHYQGDEYEQREHLICDQMDCGYEVWA